MTAAIVACPAHRTMLHLMGMIVWGGYASLAPTPGPVPTEAQRYRTERLGANQTHAQLDKHQPFRMHGPGTRLSACHDPRPPMRRHTSALLPMIAATSTDAKLWAIAAADPTFWNTPG
ncbi:MAG: hypothetical protein M1826_004261 [Phylliscum demangeonii]|nr:MAG: hypothetical protein M1826_004261 [Phylliscum demangeonii]